MSVIARFYVATTQKFAFNPDQLVVTLHPVTRGEENKSWATATPAGQVQMTIQNPGAAKFFEQRLGKDVVLRFEDGEDDKHHPSPYTS